MLRNRGPWIKFTNLINQNCELWFQMREPFSVNSIGTAEIIYLNLRSVQAYPLIYMCTGRHTHILHMYKHTHMYAYHICEKAKQNKQKLKSQEQTTPFPSSWNILAVLRPHHLTKSGIKLMSLLSCWKPLLKIQNMKQFIVFIFDVSHWCSELKKIDSFETEYLIWF